MTGSSSQARSLSFISPLLRVDIHQMPATASTMRTAGPTELELVLVAA